MKRLITTILLGGFWVAMNQALAMGQTVQTTLPEAQVTLRVIDEDGNPIKGSEAGVTFEFPQSSENPVTQLKGISDKNGLFTAKHQTILRVFYGASMEGYYKTQGNQYHFTGHKDGKWQPWNPTLDVVLKKIINPVPMYARKWDNGIPVANEVVGFDLEVGDCVAPHGKGRISDFVFFLKLESHDKMDFDSKLTVSFSNPGDGLQTFDAPYLDGSDLKSPHLAPESGYQSKWIQTRSRKPGKGEESNIDLKRNYFFRVRTVLDKNGNVKNAMYGKIYGDFPYFSYYLNPDGTRNMEFDIDHNLLKKLPSTERPNRR